MKTQLSLYREVVIQYDEFFEQWTVEVRTYDETGRERFDNRPAEGFKNYRAAREFAEAVMITENDVLIDTKEMPEYANG